MDFLNNFTRQFLLPLYGRKMLVAIYAVVVYLIGVPWEAVAVGDGAAVITGNQFFTDPMYLVWIIVVFMGGKLIDEVTDKDDDHTRSESMGVLEYLSEKTKEILQPRLFTAWIAMAVLFIVGVISDEMMFYASLSYVGVNSAQALLEHFNVFKSNVENAMKANTPDAVKKASV